MAAADTGAPGEERQSLRALRLASWFEGTTLVALVFVAVPLKHAAGYAIATKVLGPIHGFAFLLYFWMVMRALGEGGWSKSQIARLVLAAFVPFGAFANRRLLRDRGNAAGIPA